MLPISGIPLKYVNYILLFGYEHHNKYKPIYYDTVFSWCICTFHGTILIDTNTNDTNTDDDLMLDTRSGGSGVIY